MTGAIACACSKSDTSEAVVDQSPDLPDATLDTSAPGTGESGAGADADEAPLATFQCGSTTCVVGAHACCTVGAGFGCFGLDASGCPGADGGDGGDGGGKPALLCGTYRNCAKGEECCYRADAGSKCASTCAPGSANLCTLGQDKCGGQEDCKPLPTPPLANTGSCQPKK